EKIAEHDIDHRAQAGHGRADADAGDAGFRDRRIDHPFFAELLTRPARTLNGVPASATSSPMMKTVGSRRISSASASLIAWAKVISRVFASLTAVCRVFPAITIFSARAAAILDFRFWILH